MCPPGTPVPSVTECFRGNVEGGVPSCGTRGELRTKEQKVTLGFRVEASDFCNSAVPRPASPHFTALCPGILPVNVSSSDFWLKQLVGASSPAVHPHATADALVIAWSTVVAVCVGRGWKWGVGVRDTDSVQYRQYYRKNVLQNRAPQGLGPELVKNPCRHCNLSSEDCTAIVIHHS